MDVRTALVFILPLVLVAASFMYKPADSDMMIVSGSRLEKIVDQLRENTKGKWLKKLDDLNAQVEKAEKMRDGLFTRIKDSSLGEEYLKSLSVLLREKHGKLAGVDGYGANATLADVFEAFKDSERRLTNAYLDSIAARTAIQHEIPAVDAVNYAKVVQPERIALDKDALEQAIRSQTDGKLDSFKSNVLRGASEIDAIVKYAEKVLESMGLNKDDDGGEGVEIALDSQQMGSVAGETLRPNQLNMDSLGTSDGGLSPVPGRVIDDRALGNYNLRIDRWYVMGPFENRFRTAIDAKFLPESVIDLDHTTIGKGGKPISWEYWRPTKVRIEPRHAPNGAVYYGYTQVWSQQDCKVWAAVGSDDYGKFWVNGDLVWKSGTEPKAFRADEETIEVTLKRGVNNLLFRCENGGGTMGWSVIFITGEVAN
jgi:hypothetical protein